MDENQKRTNMVEFRKEEFALWWNALLDYRKHNEVASDYILFSLLQAGRSIEIAPLKWDQVDFELEEVNYDKTKNTDDYKFPLSKLALEILKRRKEFAINDYVLVTVIASLATSLRMPSSTSRTLQKSQAS